MTKPKNNQILTTSPRTSAPPVHRRRPPPMTTNAMPSVAVRIHVPTGIHVVHQGLLAVGSQAERELRDEERDNARRKGPQDERGHGGDGGMFVGPH